MGTWLATVRFPDGTTQYARYSAVVGSILEGLYPRAEVRYHRAEAAGEPIPQRPDAPPGEPLAVIVSTEPDDDAWHALFDPSRRTLLGPFSSHHRHSLQERFELTMDADGVRHLSESPLAVCGARAVAGVVPFHRPLHVDEWPDTPDVDLFGGWADGTACRTCLRGQI